MPGLIEELQFHDVIGIDTPVFIYHFEGSGNVAHLAREALRACSADALQGVTSVVTITEVLVQPIRYGDFEVAREYELALTRMPGLQLVSLDRPQASLAAELRARHGIQIGDAIQIAAALASGATGFLTNDLRLRRMTELEVLILNDYLD